MKSSLSKNYFEFAKMYHYGTNGVEKNMAKAVEWYENII